MQYNTNDAYFEKFRAISHDVFTCVTPTAAYVYVQIRKQQTSVSQAAEKRSFINAAVIEAFSFTCLNGQRSEIGSAEGIIARANFSNHLPPLPRYRMRVRRSKSLLHEILRTHTRTHEIKKHISGRVRAGEKLIFDLSARRGRKEKKEKFLSAFPSPFPFFFFFFLLPSDYTFVCETVCFLSTHTRALYIEIFLDDVYQLSFTVDERINSIIFNFFFDICVNANGCS